MVIVPMNYSHQAAEVPKLKPEEAPAGPTEAEILVQIRDLLAKKDLKPAWAPRLQRSTGSDVSNPNGAACPS